MKLLLTADLHFRLHWFRWLIEQAPSYDLVCIAGDLLDMFNVELTKGQAREVSMLIRELADTLCTAPQLDRGTVFARHQRIVLKSLSLLFRCRLDRFLRRRRF